MGLFKCDGLLTASSLAVGLVTVACAIHAYRLFRARSQSILARHYIVLALNPFVTAGYAFAMYWLPDGAGVLLSVLSSAVQAVALYSTYQIFVWWAGGQARFAKWHDQAPSRNKCRIPLIKLPFFSFANGQRAVRWKKIFIGQLLFVRPPCMLLMAITIFAVGDLSTGLRYIFRGPAIASTIIAMQNLADVAIFCRAIVDAPRKFLKLAAAQLPIIFTILQVNVLIFFVHHGWLEPSPLVSCPYNLYSSVPASGDLRARQLASVILVFESLLLAALAIVGFPVSDLKPRQGSDIEVGRDTDRESLLDEGLEQF